MNNFTNISLRNRISSCFNMLDGLLRAGVSFFASFLLRYTTTANTFIIAGCVFTIIIVLLLDRMKTRVGLKPEEYKEKDIKIMELKQKIILTSKNIIYKIWITKAKNK